MTRENCQYRHENGNCLEVGGFCTSVDYKYCQKYKEMTAGFYSDTSKVSKEELDRINANIKEQQERAYKCIKQSRQEWVESLKKELNETFTH